MPRYVRFFSAIGVWLTGFPTSAASLYGVIAPAQESTSELPSLGSSRGRRARRRYRGRNSGPSRGQYRAPVQWQTTTQAHVQEVEGPPLVPEHTGPYRGTWAGLFARAPITQQQQQQQQQEEEPVELVPAPEEELAQSRPEQGPREELPVPQPAEPSQQQMRVIPVHTRDLLSMLDWGSESSSSSEVDSQTEVDSPPPSPPIVTVPLLSLRDLADDASILLEVFSQNLPDDDDDDDNDDLGLEQQALIDSAAAGISTIQARLRQRAARANRDIADREELNRDIGDREELKPDEDCIVCYAERADTLLIPCMHLIICMVCMSWSPWAG